MADKQIKEVIFKTTFPIAFHSKMQKQYNTFTNQLRIFYVDSTLIDCCVSIFETTKVAPVFENHLWGHSDLLKWSNSKSNKNPNPKLNHRNTSSIFNKFFVISVLWLYCQYQNLFDIYLYLPSALQICLGLEIRIQFAMPKDCNDVAYTIYLLYFSASRIMYIFGTRYSVRSIIFLMYLYLYSNCPYSSTLNVQ